MRNIYDQTGGRLDFNLSPDNQIFARYSYSGGNNINPVSVRGTDVPGFPTRDDFSTHHATVSSTHILAPTLTNTLRGTFLRHAFFFDQRLNRTPPSALGFGYESSNEVGQGPPFFNVSGYSPIGGAITGPRNTTQNTFEIQDSVAWTNRSHLVKMGGEFRHTGIDMVQAIAPNAFFVFAGTFPTNNAVANLLLGAPVTFYQGLGDFARDVGVWSVSAYAQDEWRVTPRVTLNYGLRYERINPFTEAEDRLNGFIPGVQSTRQAGRTGGPRVPRRRRHRTRHCGRRPCVHAARRRRLGSHRFGRLVGPRRLRRVLRPVPERRGHVLAGGDQRDAMGAVRPVQRRRCSISRIRSSGEARRRRRRSSGRPRCSRWTPRRSRHRCRTGT